MFCHALNLKIDVKKFSKKKFGRGALALKIIRNYMACLEEHPNFQSLNSRHRQCLQYGLLIKERSVQQLTNRDKLHDVAEKVIHIWKSAHPLMPVHALKYVIDKLATDWNKAKNVSKPKASIKASKAMASQARAPHSIPAVQPA